MYDTCVSRRSRGSRSVAVPIICLALCAFSCDRDDLTNGPHKKAAEPPPPPPPASTPKDVKINEVMTINGSTLEDDRGLFPAWIELFNTSTAAVDLSGVFLSNSLIDPTLWAIPAIPAAIIPPGGYLMIFADGDQIDPNDLHAAFTLLPGQSFQLAFNRGSDVVTFDAKDLGADRSIGRTPDGQGRFVFLESPTPGAANAAETEPPEPTEPTEAEFVRGDANADGRVNIADMSFILKVLFGIEPFPSCVDRLDANDDGRADVSDSLYLGNALFRRGTPIPAPYPAPGPDPSADLLACPRAG